MSGSEEQLESLRVADAMMAAISSMDIAGIECIYAPDVVVWHNYDGVSQNKAENIAGLKAFFAIASQISYDNVRRHITKDGFVQQHVLSARFKDGTGMAPRPACMVVVVRDGRIARIDEYIERRS